MPCKAVGALRNAAQCREKREEKSGWGVSTIVAVNQPQPQMEIGQEKESSVWPCGRTTVHFVHVRDVTKPLGVVFMSERIALYAVHAQTKRV